MQKTRTRIDQREIRDGRHDEHARQQQPGHPLAEAAEQRDRHAVDDPRPQELEVVGEEGEAECRDAFLVESRLREPRRQRRADHREGKPGGDAEEESGERCALEIGPHARGKSPAPAGLGAPSPLLWPVLKVVRSRSP